MAVESGCETLSVPPRAKRNVGLFRRNGKVTSYGAVQNTLLLVQSKGKTTLK